MQASAQGATPLFVNQRVAVAGRAGTVRFAGETQFAPGVWIGVELDEACGKNSGTVKDVEYFSCPPEHGIFVRPNNVLALDEDSAAGVQHFSAASVVPATSSQAPGFNDALREGPAAVAAASSVAELSATSAQAGASGASADPGTTNRISAIMPATATPGSAEMTPVAGSTDALKADATATVSATRSTPPDLAAAANQKPGSHVAELSSLITRSDTTGQILTKQPTETGIPSAAPKTPIPQAPEHQLTPAPAHVDPAQRSESIPSQPPTVGASPTTAPEPEISAPVATPSTTPAQRVEAATPSRQEPHPEHSTLAEAPSQQEAVKEEVAAQTKSPSPDLPHSHAQASPAQPPELSRSSRTSVAADRSDDSEDSRGGPEAETWECKKLAQSAESLEAAAQASEAKAKAEAAQAEAEAELRHLRDEALSQLRAQAELRQQEADSERRHLALLRQRRDAALADAKEAARAFKEVELNAKNKVPQADAELPNEKSAAEKLRAAVKSRTGQLSVMSQIKARLQRSAKPLSRESDLQDKLQAAILTRMLAEEKLEELRLELAELELKIDEAADLRAKQVVGRLGDEGPGGRAAEYQEAIRVLHASSSRQVLDLERRIADLDRDSAVKLRHNSELLAHRQSNLQGRIADLETHAAELVSTHQAGNQLQELRNEIVLELRQELELREERCEKLGDLVQKLEKDKKELKLQVTAQSTEVASLLEVASQLTPSHTQDLGSAARTAGKVLQRLAEVDVASAKAQVVAYAACLPTKWAADADGTTENACKGAACLKLASARASAAGAAEKVLRQIQALALQATSDLGTFGPGDSAGRTPSWAERCKLSAAAWRCAATITTALDSGLWTAGANSESVNSASDDFDFQAACNVQDQRLRQLLAQSWPLTGDTRQVTMVLSDLEKHFLKAQALQASQLTLPRRAAAMTLRRLEVTISFGAAACEGDARSQLEGLCLRVRNLAARMADESVSTKLQLPGELLFKAANVFEAAWNSHDTEDGSLSALLSALNRDSGEVAAAVECLAKSLGLSRTDQGTRRRQLISNHVDASSRLATVPPSWSTCCVNVQQEVEAIFETQRQVAEAQGRLRDQQNTLALAEEQLGTAAKRRSVLQEELALVVSKHSKEHSLGFEEEKLRQEAKTLAAVQAALGRDLDSIRAKREAQESAHHEAKKQRDTLECDIDNLRRKPKELDGHATAQELAALRLARQKSARDLYAEQVSAMASLLPLPRAKVSAAEQPEKPLESCITKYVALRRGLLQEWCGTRLCRLSTTSSEPMEPTAEKMAKMQVSRIHELQLKFTELQAAAAPLADSGSPATANSRQREGAGLCE
ncbi:unnamed protein product [Polarella glacialis]|uniref:CAP-Gly domain-containing protein n=1 Tax=Polarella glacialis TaxID=89957 RepID=A0A813HNL3_POLGL|nr:unnamed protein product [Polarella glacialis]